MDEGLLQSQRGGIQAWDWGVGVGAGGGKSEGVDLKGWEMAASGNSLANPHPAAVSPPPGGPWLPPS